MNKHKAILLKKETNKYQIMILTELGKKVITYYQNLCDLKDYIWDVTSENFNSITITKL